LKGKTMSNRISADEIPADLAGVDLLIDVRAPKGRAENGEIASALILPKPLVGQVFSGPLATVPRDSRIVVFCGSVNGSGPVVQTLTELGFTNVVDVDGGYGAVKERGIA
jgi:rhodanese-related sulfurtransferase